MSKNLHNISVRSLYAGFKQGKCYDINVAILMHFSGHYMHRINSFKQFGLINRDRLSIHVTLVGSLGDGAKAEEICGAWPKDLDLTFLEMSSRHPVPKVNGYYLWLKDSELSARWHLRVDDDSITDISGLHEWADSRFGSTAVHVITSPLYHEIGYPSFGNYIREKHLPIPYLLHEYECSLTSDRAMRCVFSEPSAVEFLRETGAQIAAPSDRSLSLAMHLVGVPVAINPYGTKDFAPAEMSLVGGRYFHIHYVNWQDNSFVQFLSAYLDSPRRRIERRDVAALLGRTALFGRCISFALTAIILTPDGKIISGMSENEAKWRYDGTYLYFQKADGRPTTILCDVIASGNCTWIIGPFLEMDIMHFIKLPLEARCDPPSVE